MKNSMLNLVLILIFLVGSVVADSDDYGQVSGTIMLENHNSFLVGASVELQPLGLTTMTATDGSFLFKKVPVGKYTLVVTENGFMSVSRTVKVVSGTTTDLTVRLTANSPVGKSRQDKDDAKIKGISKEELKKRNGMDQSATHNYDSGVKPRTTSALDGIKQSPRIISEYEVNQKSSRSADGMQLSQFDIRGGRSGEAGYIVNGIAPGGCYVPVVQEPSGMYFKNYGTNRFIATRNDRLSTFALDTDDGSYNIAKEYLERSTMPPADAIRVEEFINHFDYRYADPQEGAFRLFTELTGSPYDQNLTFLKVGIKGREETKRERKPLILTFVIDVSGSMNSGGRLQLVKQSLSLLLDQLNKRDRIGIVAYGSTARVVLQTTSAAHKREIMNAVSSLHAGGSTFAEAGLKLGFKMANNSYSSRFGNRVILCSDGVANVGQTSPDAIMAQISEQALQGITLSTFGYGMGNYNDVLLEQLAIQGDGRYAYVNDMNEAREQFVNQFIENMSLLARDTKIQVEFNSKVVESYRLVGYENRAVADNQFRNNAQDGGEIGPGHEVTAIYELKLRHRFNSGFGKGKLRHSSIGTVNLRWIDPEQTAVTEISREITISDLVDRFELARPEIRLAIVGSKFAELLKQTVYTETLTYSRLLKQAHRIDRELGNAQTAELVRLIRRASELTGVMAERDSRRYNSDNNNYRAEW